MFSLNNDLPVQPPVVNILLVDDNPNNLLAMAAVLESLGHNIIQAQSGKEAVEQVLKDQFALILLDVQMPGLDGFETASLIRQVETAKYTPIIFVTAIHREEEYASRGYQVGAVDYLNKPVNTETLLAKARVLIDLYIEKERAKDEKERQEREARAALQLVAQQMALRADVSLLMTEALSVDELLQRCAEAVVNRLGAAFARIWLTDKSGTMLELKASAGIYTHIDGAHARVPVGKLKIGKIAEERKPHLTNDVLTDERIGDKQWAQREGMVAFAGYPLMVEDRLIGVMAMFARTRLAAEVLDALATAADIIAQGLERKRAEAESARLLVKEREARAAAEEANRLKDEFLATVSHELRTPLTAMLGWTRLLRDGRLDENGRARALETIERNVKLQAHIVEDILDVSRIITGNLRLDVKPIELLPIIWTAIDTIRPAADAKGIKLQLVLDHGAGRVSGDAARLQQVIWNLLSNAVKFTPEGGRIEVKLERLDSHIELTVSDSGKGISREFLPYVFDRFRQADSTITRRHGGLGLGLSITRNLVELHGGHIDVYSQGEDQGTTFKITLPVLAAPNETVKRERSTAYAGGGTPELNYHQDLQGLRVLLVEDEPDTRMMIAAVLEQYGSEVRSAGSAAEAMTALSEWQPDLLLSDIGMPDEDGYDLIKKVRASGAQLPALAVTAYTTDEDKQRVLRAGYQMHIAKPVEPSELIATIASLRRSTINFGH